MKKRPHIIVFNPDEMRSDALAHLGNPAAVTPRLDAFSAREAVSFRNAYCQNPVCVPSRCSFFTGLYPHTRGHRTMGYLLRPGESTLLSVLKEAGYHVWMNDRNDLTAGQIEGWTESHATEIYYGNQKPHTSGPVIPGFRGKKGDKYFYSHANGKLSTDERGVNYSSDDEVVDAAIERIRTRPADTPLCMFLGLIYPHVPYQIEEPYYSAIDRAKLPPRIRPDECRDKSLILEEIRKYTKMDACTEKDWDELRAIYLGMCMKVDAQFGRLVDTLKEEGIYDDCAIFFFSDHGDFAGDYGLVEKAQNTFEDCLSRVPLLVKPPKDYALDPGVSDALVELVDFYATALDMAGVSSPHTQFGRSLVPILADRQAAVRSFACCEGGRMPGETHCDEYHSCGPQGPSENSAYYPKMMAQTNDVAHAKGIMLREKRYKYVSRIAGGDELYDMDTDPGERINRINDPELASVVTELQGKMLKWLEATADIVPFEEDQRFTPEMYWARVRHLVPPPLEGKVRDLIAQGCNLAVLMDRCRSMAAEFHQEE